MCSNGILIALARYITPQDCIIKSTLDGCDSTLETKLAPKKKKKTSRVLMTSFKSGTHSLIAIKKEAKKYQNNENNCADKVDFVFPRCEYHLV